MRAITRLGIGTVLAAIGARVLMKALRNVDELYDAVREECETEPLPAEVRV